MKGTGAGKSGTRAFRCAGHERRLGPCPAACSIPGGGVLATPVKIPAADDTSQQGEKGPVLLLVKMEELLSLFFKYPLTRDTSLTTPLPIAIETQLTSHNYYSQLMDNY